jgi:type IV pilus assembly protein PilW
MKNENCMKPAQKGFSLVEIMVAMTIGMILLGAVAYLFLGSRQINRTQDDLSRMQENGRYALDILGRAIRQAGGRTDDQLKLLMPLSVNAADVPLAATNGAGTTPDTLTARYITRTGETDCAGATVAANGLVTYIFSIDTTGARPKLMCSNGTTTVAVADDIENMQILFGLDTSANGTVASYVAPSASINPINVRAVRVSLLVRSASNSVAVANQRYAFPQGAAATTATDLHLRQVYTVTFSTRNPLGKL